jgi:hypothetical protein
MKLLYASGIFAMALFAGCAKPSSDATALNSEIAELKRRNALLDENYQRDLKTFQTTTANLQRDLDALAKKEKDDNVQVYSDVIKAVHGVLDNLDDKISKVGVKSDSNVENLKAEIRTVRAELAAKADNGRVTELKNRTLGEDEDLALAPPDAPLRNQIGDMQRLLVQQSELETPGGVALVEAKGTFEKRIGDLEENVLTLDNRLRVGAP